MHLIEIHVQSHPQLTLRTQSSGGPLKDTSRCTRSVTLTCLMCQTIVYRVQHNIPIDTAGKDGARLPTNDWAEKEILKSASGWIERHDSCLVSPCTQSARCIVGMLSLSWVVGSMQAPSEFTLWKRSPCHMSDQ